MFSLFYRLAMFAVAGALLAAFAPQARAAGAIDPKTVIVIPHGTFGGVRYARYEAMFQGVSSARRAYQVPCQIIAPLAPADGSGLVLFDWLNSSTIFTPFGREEAIGREVLTDEFLFGQGHSYATVRCDPAGIGRLWSDGRLDTSTEFIQSAGDEFDIVVDWVKALSADPVAVQILGPIDRMAAFGYSACGARLRGLLRLEMGKGLFDFSLVGACGSGFSFPKGNGVGQTWQEKPPLAEAGLEIDFNTESELLSGARAEDTRYDCPNYRTYEFAGTAHVPRPFAWHLGLPDADKANPADFTPFIRALFVAGDNWCDGVEPPPSIWLGKPKDSRITRDAKGNALVRYIGGEPADTTGHRLPEVAVGENQYIAIDPSYDDGSVVGTHRVLSGGYVDLTGSFTSHSDYVKKISYHARGLQELGYLLKPDADAIILRAVQSDTGKP